MERFCSLQRRNPENDFVGGSALYNKIKKVPFSTEGEHPYRACRRRDESLCLPSTLRISSKTPVC
jgi:hypothetical protein